MILNETKSRQVEGAVRCIWGGAYVSPREGVRGENGRQSREGGSGLLETVSH